MAQPIQGLRVALKFGDTQDNEKILSNLKLPLGDLDRIRDIAVTGVTKEDIISLSGIDIDIEKSAVAIYGETASYPNLLRNLNDSRSRISHNLLIGGQLVAPSYKFNIVDIDDSNAIKTISLSTSRSSAWSSFGNSDLSIFYGADVIVTSGNHVEVGSIEFSGEVIAKEFDSQIPTHKIRMSVDGVEYDMYAMKSIPLVFECSFASARSLSMRYNIVPTGQLPTWTIENDDNDLRYVYENVSTGSGLSRLSTISFNDSRTLNRKINIFYPVDRITTLSMSRLNLYSMPNTVLPSLLTLDISGNDLIEMPRLNILTPALTTLVINDNDMSRSFDPSIVNFNQAVLERLPDTLTSVTMGSTYGGDTSVDFGVVGGLPNLKVFILNSGSTNTRMTGNMPEINDELTRLDIANCRFDTISTTILNSSSLEYLNIRNNDKDFGNSIDFPNMDELQQFYTGYGNRHNVINMAGKTNLETYITSDMTFTSPDDVGTNMVNGCTSLVELRTNHTNIKGSLPDFNTNPLFELFTGWNTTWEDYDSNYSISDTTFGVSSTSGCRGTLRYFNLQSSKLSGPVQINALRNMTALNYFKISSYDKGITGTLPDIKDCFKLSQFHMNRNNLSGEIPSLNANIELRILNLASNNFSGEFPFISLPKLKYILVSFNNLTGFSDMTLPELRYLNANNNSLSSIPNLTALGKVTNISLQNNNISGYIKSNLSGLSKLRNLNISNNNLTTGDIDNILIDLNENYDLNSRSNVTINLTGNAPSSSNEIISAIIAKLSSAGWSIGLS